MNQGENSLEKKALIYQNPDKNRQNKLGENRLNSTLKVVLGVLIIWVISVGLFVYKNVQKANQMPENSASISPESSPENAENSASSSPESSPENAENSASSSPESSPSVSPQKSPSLPPVNPYFREAVSKAESASNMVGLAKSREQWRIVIKQWEEAIELMEKVPPSSPQYPLAQKKVSEYRKYLKYAKQTARESK